MIMKKCFITICLALIAMTGWAGNDLKPRLVVYTDIAPADVEPDDMESMVRLMAYADCFELDSIQIHEVIISRNWFRKRL
jgi:hypothetical protein